MGAQGVAAAPGAVIVPRAVIAPGALIAPEALIAPGAPIIAGTLIIPEAPVALGSLRPAATAGCLRAGGRGGRGACWSAGPR